MEINLNLTPEENLLAQINYDNQGTGLNLTTHKVFFGPPSGRQPDADANNSSVVVYPMEGDVYFNEATLTYTRFPIDYNYDYANQPVILVSSPQTYESVKILVSQFLGVVTSELELNYGEPPAMPGDSDWFNYSVKENSLLYTPGYMEISVRWPE